MQARVDWRLCTFHRDGLGELTGVQLADQLSETLVQCAAVAVDIEHRCRIGQTADHGGTGAVSGYTQSSSILSFCVLKSAGSSCDHPRTIGTPMARNFRRTSSLSESLKSC